MFGLYMSETIPKNFRTKEQVYRTGNINLFAGFVLDIFHHWPVGSHIFKFL